MIDTIIIVTENVFDVDEARSNTLFRIANAVRIKTRATIVRRELLFRQGELFDSASVAETERNLRRLGIFRDVVIDSLRVGGKLAVQIRTADGWSTQLTLNGRTTGNTFTWAAGVAERNFLGRATFVSFTYRKDPDRNAMTLGFRSNRLFGSRIAAIGFVDDLSDGTRGVWAVGYPFRSFSDRRAVEIAGEAADQRILQFIVRSATDRDTVEYQRRAFSNRATATVAPIAAPGHYLRLGVMGQVKREEFLLRQDTAVAIPDTVTGAVGLFAEFRRVNFKVVTHFNGFAQAEDLDLSSVVRFTTWLAPTAFGYARTGVGPRLSVTTAASIPSGFVRFSALASGLFTSVGLDSGRVAGALTVGTQLVRRNATILHVRAGAMKRPGPGREFDLGHGLGPRSFGPHAFTGNRNIWGTFEHRWFVVDDLFHLLGLGLAAFLDYGGAWFDGNEPLYGGNVGLGLRMGGSRATAVSLGRLDLAYQFGEGRTGGRWVISTGRGFAF